MAIVRAPLRGLRVAANRQRFSLPSIVWLTVFVAVLFLARLGHRDLYSSHEARAAQNAQRMLDTGEWGLPILFDGQADLQKPPGYYWMVAAAGYFNGGTVTAFEARLPAALAGLFTVLMGFAFLKGEGRPVAAWVAAIVLATAVHFTAISRTARIDVPLACAVTASLICFWKALTAKPQVSWVLLSAFAAAAGVMLKGPIALALIGPAAVVYLAVERRFLPLWCIALGTVTVFALAAPWFVWANYATGGEFFQIFFWHHNVERFAGTSPTLASHPWWYYVPRFAVDFLPWTPALAMLGLWNHFSPARRASKDETRPLLARRAGDAHFRFGLVWFATMFLVLSMAHFKRADYLLPLFPGAAIALGCAAEAWLATRSARTAVAAKWLLGIVVACSLVGWQLMSFVVEPAEQAKEEKRAFAEMIRSHAPPPLEVLLFRTEPHLLAFHLGRPILSRVEWHDLNDWASAPGPHFVVMPPEYAAFAQHIVRSRKLVEVGRLADYTAEKPPRPLVFLRVE